MELARRYSNNLELLSRLTRTWRHIHGSQHGTTDDGPTLRSATHGPERPHALHRRLTPDTIATLLADYQAGTSSLELARRYGIGKSSVLRLLDAHHIPRRHQPLTPEQLATAIQMYEGGLSVAAVSAQLGLAARTVHRSLQRAGVTMRDTHGRARP